MKKTLLFSVVIILLSFSTLVSASYFATTNNPYTNRPDYYKNYDADITSINGSSSSSGGANSSGWLNSTTQVYLANNATNVSIGRNNTLVIDTTNNIVTALTLNVTNTINGNTYCFANNTCIQNVSIPRINSSDDRSIGFRYNLTSSVSNATFVPSNGSGSYYNCRNSTLGYTRMTTSTINTSQIKAFSIVIQNYSDNTNEGFITNPTGGWGWGIQRQGSGDNELYWWNGTASIRGRNLILHANNQSWETYTFVMFSNQTYQEYINGVLVANAGIDFSTSQPAVGMIICYGAGSGETANMNWRDARFWNTTLNTSDVTNVYNNLSVQPGNLLAYYPVINQTARETLELELDNGRQFVVNNGTSNFSGVTTTSLNVTGPVALLTIASQATGVLFQTSVQGSNRLAITEAGGDDTIGSVGSNTNLQGAAVRLYYGAVVGLLLNSVGNMGIGISTTTPTQKVEINGSINISNVGRGGTRTYMYLSGANSTLAVSNGSNGCLGKAVLVSGVAQVATTCVTNNSIILLTTQVSGGTIGDKSINGQNAGIGFNISAVATDTSTVGWFIMEPTS